MTLDQNADSLNKKEFETTYHDGIGFYWFGFYTGEYEVRNFYILYNIGFQQRINLLDSKIEFQLNFNPFFTAGFGGSYMFMNYNYFDIGFKFHVYSNNNWNISLIPYTGVFSDIKTHLFGNFYFDFGVYNGFKFITSHYLKDGTSIYFGLSYQFNKNLLYTYNMLLFDMDSGFSLGWELEKKNKNAS